jgi:hypothetical protein
MLRRAAAGVIAVLLAVPLPAVSEADQPGKAAPQSLRPITVRADPIAAFDPRDPALRRFGALEFRGGLVLRSPDKAFGGFSALHVTEDGRRLLAASDRGDWLRGEIRYDGERLVAVEQAEMAPMLGPDGRPLARRGWFDAEALAVDGGTLYVGIERVNRIVRFDYGRHGLKARAEVVAVPPAVRKLPFNRGIEGLIFVPRGRPLGGTLIAFAERALDEAGNHTAFLIGGPDPGTLAIRRSDDFDISDAALLPAGDALILERRFDWVRGVAIRIRRIPLAHFKPGALLDGPIIFSAGMAHQIDNMEGLAVHRSGGATVLTLISDDNFSALQRTLVLQFTLIN